jgi:hypothetical protein
MRRRVLAIVLCVSLTAAAHAHATPSGRKIAAIILGIAGGGIMLGGAALLGTGPNPHRPRDLSGEARTITGAAAAIVGLTVAIVGLALGVRRHDPEPAYLPEERLYTYPRRRASPPLESPQRRSSLSMRLVDPSP